MADIAVEPNAIPAMIRTRTELAAAIGCPSDTIAKIVADPSRHYTSFEIPKADGTSRTIQPPIGLLKTVQRAVLKLLYKRARLPRYLHGGIPGRSPMTHAKMHVGRRMVATLDLRKFFPSTHQGLLEPALARLGFRAAAKNDLLLLSTLNGSLPQGSPTSSILANLAFAPGDRSFLRICRKGRLVYSRYVDDIAISGDRFFDGQERTFISAIHDAGYKVADNKVFFTKWGQRQVVTGLVVNDRLRPTREYLRELKHDIRLCIKMGARAVADSEGTTIQTIKARLTGRVSHVASVAPDIGSRLRGMLCGVDWRSNSVACPPTHVLEF